MTNAIRTFESDWGRWSAALGSILVATCLTCGCTDHARVSAQKAAGHVPHLVTLTVADVEEVRSGLPEGAVRLKSLWTDGNQAEDDPERARDALNLARRKVQDLRVAKSTFFAVALPNGQVVRNDQSQDLMAGKDLFKSYPALKGALSNEKAYSETVGSMHEARGVEGRPDGQWTAAAAIKDQNETVLGLYVTGWSWAHYARRLEAGLQTHLRESEEPLRKKPLIYVFVVVGDQAYGTHEAPTVNADAVTKQKVLSQLKNDEVSVIQLQITGRDFGLAAKRAPALGENVAVAVLRSET